MNRYRSLAQNIGLFAVNSIATRLISFLLLPLYTYYLSEGEYGVTDMALTVIALMVPLATLSISEAVLRFSIEEGERSDSYITIGYGVVALSAVFVAASLPLLDLGIFGGLGEYKFWYWLTYVTNALLGYQSSVARALDQIRIIPISAGLSSLATLVGAFVFVAKLGEGVRGYFISVVIGGIVGSLSYEVLGRHRRHLLMFGFETWRVDLKRMLVYAIPLVPNALFWWVNNSVSRFFVVSILGISANGLFAAASKMPNILNVVFQVFQQAWQVSAYREFSRDDADGFFTTVFSLLQFAMFSCAALLSAAAPWLAHLLLQNSFFQAWTLVPMLFMAFVFSTMFSFYGTVYTSSMNTRALFVTTLVGAVATVVGCWILVPRLGLLGACLSGVMSNGLVFLARVRGVASTITISSNWSVFCVSVAFLLAQSVLAAVQVPNYALIGSSCAVVVIGLQLFQARDPLYRLSGAVRRWLPWSQS